MKAVVRFWGGCLLSIALAYVLTLVIGNEYPFFAGYVVIQFVLLATAWNIAAGYAGYVNFGAAGFFGIGAYTAVAIGRAVGPSIAIETAGAAIVGAALSLAIAYLSVRLRGIYYSIATIAVAVILESAIVNWPYVGGSRGLTPLRPATPPGFGSYTTFLFVYMLVLAVIGVAIARAVERSKLGRGLAAIRDNEAAAEACGVPTLGLKAVAITMSGTLMAVAGAPYALYASYVEPGSAFNMSYSLAALAMPLFGGTATWVGPVVGAVVLALSQQLLTIYASSEVNLLVLGLILVLSVVLLPGGMIGLLRRQRRPA